MVDRSQSEKQSPLTLTVDYRKYTEFLEEATLTEAEKAAFIDSLWSVIVSFVDLGFQVHPMQDVCESDLVKAFDKVTVDKEPSARPLDTPSNNGARPDKGEGRSPL